MTAPLPAASPGSESDPNGLPRSALPSVQEVYEAHVDFVWRSARRMGVRSPQLEDIVQEVFVVVQRRLPDFEGRSSLRTWLFAITRHVVRAHMRRSAHRPQPWAATPVELEDKAGRCPESQLLAHENLRLLHALLEQLDPDEREVFILAQLEEMSGPEIAQALELPVRSVYSRIVAAQKAFERALRRSRARERSP